VPTSHALASSALIDGLTAIAVEAASAILRTPTRSAMRIKADGSPVTSADDAADAAIRAGLARLAPDFPVISEELVNCSTPDFPRTGVFLVDPLDGTREFIAGRDEYTVNIALISGGLPELGVIAAPALQTIWRGIVGAGAERLRWAADGSLSPPTGIRSRWPAGALTVMVSRSHLDPQTEAFVRSLRGATRVPCGSSMKFCRLAEGAADVYPRLAPTRDWDTAAGHAILSAAGGLVTTPSGGALHYGSPDLRLPAFVAWGDSAIATAILRTSPVTD